MPSKTTRRKALKELGAAGVGLAAVPVVLRGQDTSITVAGQPIEIIVSSVSPTTVRLTAAPLRRALVQDDGATRSVRSKPAT
jgi:hypothetical protein